MNFVSSVLLQSWCTLDELVATVLFLFALAVSTVCFLLVTELTEMLKKLDTKESSQPIINRVAQIMFQCHDCHLPSCICSNTGYCLIRKGG